MKIQELLSNNSKWTQGAIARRADGEKLRSATSKTAVCWCLKGAIKKCYPSNFLDIERKVRIELSVSIVTFNDETHRIFSDIRALIERLNI